MRGFGLEERRNASKCHLRRDNEASAPGPVFQTTLPMYDGHPDVRK
jgi:hypothetical protein